MSAIVVLNWRCYRAGALKDCAAQTLNGRGDGFMQRVQHARVLPSGARRPPHRIDARVCLGLAPCPHAATTSLQPSDTARRKNRAFTAHAAVGGVGAAGAHAAFGGVREREKAGWTNDLHYPIGVKITRRIGFAEGAKRLRGKDLRGTIERCGTI